VRASIDSSKFSSQFQGRFVTPKCAVVDSRGLQTNPGMMCNLFCGRLRVEFLNILFREGGGGGGGGGGGREGGRT